MLIQPRDKFLRGGDDFPKERMTTEFCVGRECVDRLSQRDGKANLKRRAWARIAVFVVHKDDICHSDFVKMVVGQAKRDKGLIFFGKRLPFVLPRVMVGCIDNHTELQKLLCKLFGFSFKSPASANHD